MIQEYLAGSLTLTDSELAVADVTGDGKVKVSDATMIQKYIADIIDEFPNGSVALLNYD